MGILLDRNTRMITIGLNSTLAQFHTTNCREYGTNVVGAVIPGLGGTTKEGVPIFNTISHAKKNTRASVAMIFLPPQLVLDGILECIEAEIPLIICTTTGVPLHDMLKLKSILLNSKSQLIGPSSVGIITPGECKVGVMPGFIFMPGNVGVVSRSGSLLYEIVSELTKQEIGQSTCVGLGGDNVIGSDFIDVIKLFEKDHATKLILILGEIGGNYEIDVAHYIKKYISKPVVAYVAGSMMPRDRQVGHSGMEINTLIHSAEKKLEVFEECAVNIVRSPDKIAQKVKKLIYDKELI